MTMKQAAQQAIDIQDGCNLSGILGAFKDVVFDVLWPEARRLGKGTDWVNQHPICTMFLDKLSDLNGRKLDTELGFSHAYDDVLKLAEPEPEHVPFDSSVSLQMD